MTDETINVVGVALTADGLALCKFEEQFYANLVADYEAGVPYGTHAREQATAQAAEQNQPFDEERLALIYKLLWAPAPGAPGYPLAFADLKNAMLFSPAAKVTSGPFGLAGHFEALGGFIRPVVPAPQQNATTAGSGKPPPGGGGGGGGDDDPPDDGGDDPPAEKRNPYYHPDPGFAGGGGGGDGGTASTPTSGKPYEPGGGDVAPCDIVPFTPNELPGLAGVGEDFTAASPAATVQAATFSAAARSFFGGGITGELPRPGTKPLHPAAMRALGFGYSAIQPARPREMRPWGDQRQRLGGGVLAPSLSIVPRGGTAILDRSDFAPGHTTNDIFNVVIERLNQVIAQENDRHPMDTGIETAGSHLPTQKTLPPPDTGRFRAGDEVQAFGGERYRLIPRVTGQPGGFNVVGPRWGKIASDAEPTRVLGSGERGQDVEVRFDTGYPGFKGTGRRDDNQPKLAWRPDLQAMSLEGPNVRIRTDTLTRVGADGASHAILDDTTTTYVKRDGSLPLTADWNAGYDHAIRAGTLEADAINAPFDHSDLILQAPNGSVLIGGLGGGPYLGVGDGEVFVQNGANFSIAGNFFADAAGLVRGPGASDWLVQGGISYNSPYNGRKLTVQGGSSPYNWSGASGGDLELVGGTTQSNAQAGSVRIRGAAANPDTGYGVGTPGIVDLQTTAGASVAKIDTDGIWKFMSTVALPKKADPGSPFAGEAWVNGKSLEYRDNQGSPATQTVEIQSNKNAAGGYAGLSAGSKIAASQMSGVLASSDLTNDAALEKTANKNATNGYAGLSGGKVAASQIQEVIALADLTDVTAKTGSGTTVVMDTGGTIVAPTIKASGSADAVIADAGGLAKITVGHTDGVVTYAGTHKISGTLQIRGGAIASVGTLAEDEFYVPTDSPEIVVGKGNAGS